MTINLLDREMWAALSQGLIGLVLGLGAGWFWLQRDRQRMERQNSLLAQQAELVGLQAQQLQTQLAEAQQQREQSVQALNEANMRLAAYQEKTRQLDYWRAECEQLNQELRHLRELNGTQEAELREMATRLEETRLASEEKQRLWQNSEQRLMMQFESLAARIFENSGRQVDEQNRRSLEGLLAPLREQLNQFHRQVQDGLTLEARERHTLVHEIRNLQALNAQMAKEALNLTRALKGDNKTQGNWGEVILSRVLEASGLREHYEYQMQVSLQHQDNRRVQPDVIVHLPQEKDVVIDAKVSLVAYERYFNSEDEIEREKALREHVLSVRNHIRLLGQKDYHRLPGVRSLDYVLMFIAVEPAFLCAIDHQPELINEALSHNIMLVSPTTLLVALRTINNLWRYENQNRNAQLIAERAARLYDKMRLFVDEMDAVGQALGRAQDSYQQAMKRLAQGRGNMLSQVESFRTLGVEVKKAIATRSAAIGETEVQQDLATEE